jgi:hypothetical protein
MVIDKGNQVGYVADASLVVIGIIGLNHHCTCFAILGEDCMLVDFV